MNDAEAQDSIHWQCCEPSKRLWIS